MVHIMGSINAKKHNSCTENIWRNDVLFTNLQSGHLGISMIDFNKTEFIEKIYIFFQIIQPLAIGKYERSSKSS